MPFSVRRLELPGVLLISPGVMKDARGFFIESYKLSEFTAAGIPVGYVQDNHSRSAKNVVRGLHYQLCPKEQGKLVRCTRGKVFDVCVDIRDGSPTFGRWAGVELSEENAQMLYVPEGFAHGFAALSDGAEVIYKCTAEYSREHERGILWNDPAVGIRWPVDSPLLSEKDSRNPPLAQAERNFSYIVPSKDRR